MGQFGFFDADKRLAAISAKGDPLEMIALVVPFGKHPAWAAGRLFGAVPSQLKQRGVVFFDFYQLDQAHK
jgi:hypothetical protein